MDDTPRAKSGSSPGPERSEGLRDHTAASDARPDPRRPGPRTPPAAPTRKRSGRGVLWAILAVIIAFGAGYAWQYLEAESVRSELSAVERQLSLERLRVQLARATLAAQAGDFEAARQQMSGLFDSLQEQMEMLPEEVTVVARGFLTRRDDVITGLSRSNPAYADILYGMLQRLGTALDRIEQDAEAAPDDEIEAPGPDETGPAGGAGPEG